MKLLRQLFCRHQFQFVRNLYGDQSIEWGNKRSVFKCAK